jgi:hypothetical protein
MSARMSNQPNQTWRSEKNLREIAAVRRALDREADLLVQEMCANDAIRREMLWLRAKEKGDEDTARDLESVDPTLKTRLLPIVMRIEHRHFRSSREESEAWSEEWHRRLEFHTARILGGRW